MIQKVVSFSFSMEIQNKFTTNRFPILSLPPPPKGMSKFAKLARSVTRSRQFNAHLPAIKDPSKQSNFTQVTRRN